MGSISFIMDQFNPASQLVLAYFIIDSDIIILYSIGSVVAISININDSAQKLWKQYSLSIKFPSLHRNKLRLALYSI